MVEIAQRSSKVEEERLPTTRVRSLKVVAVLDVLLRLRASIAQNMAIVWNTLIGSLVLCQFNRQRDGVTPELNC